MKTIAAERISPFRLTTHDHEDMRLSDLAHDPSTMSQRMPGGAWDLAVLAHLINPWVTRARAGARVRGCAGARVRGCARASTHGFRFCQGLRIGAWVVATGNTVSQKLTPTTSGSSGQTTALLRQQDSCKPSLVLFLTQSVASRPAATRRVTEETS